MMGNHEAGAGVGWGGVGWGGGVSSECRRSSCSSYLFILVVVGMILYSREPFSASQYIVL